jgi:hypothetical protein
MNQSLRYCTFEEIRIRGDSVYATANTSLVTGFHTSFLSDIGIIGPNNVVFLVMDDCPYSVREVISDDALLLGGIGYDINPPTDNFYILRKKHTSDHSDIIEETEEVKVYQDNNRKCIVCDVNEKSVILIPCGHLHICGECVGRLKEEQKFICPICRESVRKYVSISSIR